MMKKEIKQIEGKKSFLLGVNEYGEKVYLEEPSWDCGWYWGLGYIETYKNGRHVSHNHWDTYIIGKREGYNHDKKTWVQSDYSHHPNDENSPLTKTTLTEKESWQLAELMKTCYNLKTSAEVFGRGGSHITTLPEEQKIVENKEWSEKINKEMLPALFEEIEKIFTEGSE